MKTPKYSDLKEAGKRMRKNKVTYPQNSTLDLAFRQAALGYIQSSTTKQFTKRPICEGCGY